LGSDRDGYFVAYNKHFYIKEKLAV
jgi:hypothetical protein